MEGKEIRFGIVASALFAVITTAASCGAVNAMHASFMPLGGMVPLINMELGEIIVGGVGAGLYGMLLFVIVAMFVAGPDGRPHARICRQEARGEGGQDDHAGHPGPAAGDARLHRHWRSVVGPGLAGLLNKGPHGFAEILYAYTSAAANNGSAFAGLTANSPFYNLTLGIAMLLGRFGMIVPMLAVAGSLAAKKRSAPSLGTLPTTRAAVRRPAGRRHPDRRRPHLLPGPGPRPDRRASRDARRHPVLSRDRPMLTQSSPLQSHAGTQAACR